jgi:hypothetical protein
MAHPKIREDQLFLRLGIERQEIREIRLLKQNRKIREIKGNRTKIRPPFQNNYVNEDYDGYFEDNMNCYDDKETKVFLTKEEHDQFMDVSEILLQDEEERVSVEREDYETGLQNAIMQFQRQYNL